MHVATANQCFLFSGGQQAVVESIPADKARPVVLIKLRREQEGVMFINVKRG